jgi:hypothetical protein
MGVENGVEGDIVSIVMAGTGPAMTIETNPPADFHSGRVGRQPV